MNKWIKKVVTTLLVAAQFVIIPVVSAQSLDEIQSQKKTTEAEINQVQKDLNDRLSEASELSILLEKLAGEIETQEITIKETEEEVAEQEVVVEKRYDFVADQLKVMQKSEVNHNMVLGLFQAESLSDLINRFYTASVITNANEEHLNEAHSEYEKLNEMKEELLVQKESLDDKKSDTDQKKSDLDRKLADLKSTLAANQKQLDQLSTEEAKVQSELAAAKEAKAAQPIKTTSSSKQESSISKESKIEQEKPTENTNQEQPAEDTDTGSWMSFQSTGYSTQQEGLSTQTATGINLLVNPRVIAVDPSQIPLGSLVEVQGMGVYIAGDTGGAIKGRIIDVHFPTVGQAMSWGRRNVNIRILN